MSIADELREIADRVEANRDINIDIDDVIATIHALAKRCEGHSLVRLDGVTEK